MNRILSKFNSTLKLAALFIFLIPLFSILAFNLNSSNVANAESVTSDLNVSIESTIYLSLTNCDSSDPSSININIDPTSAGTFKSACQDIVVTTNTPGYSLSAKALSTDNTNNLLYQNPTTITPTPKINSTSSTNTLTNPATLSNNTWGFAMKQQTGMSNTNFDTTYTINDSTNKYANLPTTDTELYSTTTFPAPLTEFTSYYGTKIDYDTLAGTYQTTITYTALGGEPASIPEVACVSGSQFKKSVGTMQNLQANKLTSIGDTGIAIDTRNNQEYCVGRLADDNIWMLNNLKIDGTTVSSVKGNATLTPKDTNVAANWTIPDAGQSSADTYDQAAYTQPIIDKDVSIPGANSEQTDINAEDFYGYYYNWCAAKGGTDESCTERETYPTENSYDICPVGWRLPTGYATEDAAGDFAYLNGMMAGDGTYSTEDDAVHAANWLFTGQFRGMYSGARLGTSEYFQGDIGGLWTNSFDLSDSVNAMSVFFDSGYYDVSVNAGNDSTYRAYKFSVRCLFPL